MDPVVLQSQTDAAEAYEEFFVPAIFRPWVDQVADAAQLGEGQRVLDIACGTGILAREAAARVGPRGSVAGLDADRGMLTVAARLAPEVEWKQGTAESLPYAAGSFDAVLSQFGLMFFSDRLQALREMIRVLTPGGRLAVAVWDDLDHIPEYAAEVALVGRLAGDRAADALRMPFTLGKPKVLEGLFARAGAASVVVRTVPGVARFPSIRWMVEADLRGWLPLVGVTLPEELIQRILDESEEAVRPLVRAEKGAIEFAMPAHIATGMKP